MRVATYRDKVPMRWVVMLYMILCLAKPGWGAVASLLERGNSLFYEERYTEAIAVYQEVIRTEPTNTHAYYQLGNVYAARGDYKKAIEAYRNALRYQPEPSLTYVVYQELGAIYGKRGQNDAAIAAFQAARKLAPDEPDTY